jgi:hypothetical protein
MSASIRSGHFSVWAQCPLSANSGHRRAYSINSSARARSVGGTVRPSVLAVSAPTFALGHESKQIPKVLNYKGDNYKGLVERTLTVEN